MDFLYVYKIVFLSCRCMSVGFFPCHGLTTPEKATDINCIWQLAGLTYLLSLFRQAHLGEGQL